jgi:hypothetical protein
MVYKGKKLIPAKSGSEAIREFRSKTQDKYIFTGLGRVQIKGGKRVYPVKYRTRA